MRARPSHTASVVVPHRTHFGAFDLLHAHAGDEESLVEAQPSSPQPLWIREQGVEETTLVGQMGVYGEGRGHLRVYSPPPPCGVVGVVCSGEDGA